MSTKWRCRLAAGFLVALAGMGCNPLTLPFFLMYPMTGSKVYAEFDPAPKEEDKPVKVLAMLSSHGYIPPEFIGSDRTLASMFIQNLQRGFEENKRDVTVVSLADFEQYKRDHPNWRSKHPVDIAAHFGADYVIDLEVTHLSMYEPGSPHLYRGRSAVSVKAHDAGGRISEPVYQTEYTREYPKTRMVDVNDTPPSQFRLNFLKAIAQELAWKFTDHLLEQEQVD